MLGLTRFHRGAKRFLQRAGFRLHFLTTAFEIGLLFYVQVSFGSLQDMAPSQLWCDS